MREILRRTLLRPLVPGGPGDKLSALSVTYGDSQTLSGYRTLLTWAPVYLIVYIKSLQ